MAFRIADLVKVMAAAGGSGAFTVASTVANFRPFHMADCLAADGDQTFYRASNGAEFEIGIATRTGAATMARTTILVNSAGNAAPINFSAAPEIICTLPAAQMNVTGSAGFSAVSTVVQAMGAGAAKIIFGAEDFDLANAFDLPNSRFIAPVAGTYVFTAAVSWSVPPTGSPLVTLFKNGVAAMHIDNGVAGASRVNAVGALQLNAGDVVELYLNVNGVNAGTVSNGTRFQGFLLHGTAVTVNGSGGREVLQGARTYYVRTDGNDGNTGLANTAAGAFLTLQKAADAIDRLDLNGFNVTVQVADGTYTAGVKLPLGVGRGDITFVGNPATPANVVINPAAGNCFLAHSARVWFLNGFKLQSASRGIECLTGGCISFSNMDFGACTSGHMSAVGGGCRITALTNYTVSGSASGHAILTDGASLDTNGKTITLTGTPSFAGLAWVYMRSGAIYNPFGCTFVGAATGPRYNITHGAIIFTNGGSTTMLPGNSAGFQSNGAIYG